MKRKIQKTYMFDKDVIEHSQNNPFISSFAEWVCEKYYSEFMTTERISNHINHCKYKLAYLKEELKEIKKQPSLLASMLTEKEIKWFKKDCIPNSKKYCLKALYNRFCNTFNRQINMKQFKIIIKLIKEGSEDGSN